MDQLALWWSSCCPVQRIDNIKPPIHEKQLKFCYFWKLAGSHRSHCWKGGLPSRTRLAALQGGVRVARGDRGAGLQLGGDAVEDCLTLLSPRGKPVMIEPSWKEARGVAISSPLDILLVGAPRRM